MSSRQSYVELNDGHCMPQLGLGTWLSKPAEVGCAVDYALTLGYRHVDCAFLYQNEAEIGVALGKHLSQGKLKRNELFVTSKVWNTFHSRHRVSECLDQSLKDLQVPYLDMYLIHWPVGYYEGTELFPMKDGSRIFSDVDYLDTWKGLEDAVLAGKVKSIGLSNFSMPQIQRVIDNSKIKPSNLQVELHPYLIDEKLVKFCKSNGITVCAYSPLANPGSDVFRKPGQPSLFDEPLLSKLASKYSKTIGQIVLRWGIQRGTVVIPKSVRNNHIEENFKIWDFALSDEDMKFISALNKNLRFVTVDENSAHQYHPFK